MTLILNISKKMTDSVKKAVEKYIDMMSQNMGVKIKFKEDDGRYQLLFAIDYGKYDKNSKKYDKTYHNKIYNDSDGGFFRDGREKVQDFIHNMKKLFNLQDSIQSGFSYYNYDHLEEVIEQVKKAISKSEYPQIDVGFENEYDNPTLYLKFKNTPFTNRETFKTFYENIKNNVDYDLDAYNWSYRKM